MGSHIVILNSTKAAQDLLEKRSSIYSDRYDSNACRTARPCHLPIQHAFQTAHDCSAEVVCLMDFRVVVFLTTHKTWLGLQHWLCTIWRHLAPPAPGIPHQLSSH
jgi:hypothetical protein